MKRVIVSGGGTGGHIFPAIAIADALRIKEPDIDILFIGAAGRMEMVKVPAAGYPIEGLNISGFQRRLTLKNLAFPFKLAGSLIKARCIISRFKPDVVIGVGGYASGPTLRMATSKNIPSLIQEQNSYPGITNRLLGNRVQKICVAYEGMEKFFPENKIIFTGNPIRQDLMNFAGKRQEALQHFGLESGKKTLLVIGGSLGAGTINQAMLKFISESSQGPDIQILWQTGKFYYDNIRGKFPEPVQKIQNPTSKFQNPVILSFIDRMDLAYAAADIIVSRAGAIAISELCVAGKPVILIPSPNVSEDHQTKNARALESRQAAILLPDSEAVEKLGRMIIETLNNDALQANLRRNIASLGVYDAAEKIAETALSLVSETKEINRTDNALLGPKSIYFLGIGGIGMSALARYYALQGVSVSGYDRTPTALTDQLIGEGMQIHFTENADLLPADTELVVYTPAIPKDNLEFKHFQQLAIPMKKRAEVLGRITANHKTIAIAGTHGKTTTSTMIAHMLRTAGIGSMAFLGGISKNYGTNFLAWPDAPGIQGSQDNLKSDFYCVVEADEYDKSFLQLNPYIAIITSADADHLDIYGNHDDMKSSFAEFTTKILGGGALVMKSGTNITPVNNTGYRIYDYAFNTGPAFYSKNIRIEEGLYHFDFVNPDKEISDLVLGVPGKFNLENAIAALAVGHLVGIREEQLRDALRSYQGVQRRFEFRVHRPDAVYIDDYAHHPEELRACISAVRELFPHKRITGIFQPHLFSRTRDLADDFAKSLELLDELILIDIYPAREKPIPGVTSQMLLDRIDLPDKKLVQKEDILEEIKSRMPEVLLTLGAGDIDQLVEPITRLFSTPNP